MIVAIFSMMVFAADPIDPPVWREDEFGFGQMVRAEEDRR